MNTAVKTILIAMFMSFFCFQAKPLLATTIDPFAYFNVYSLGNIGGGTGYGSDFQGTTGAVGNVTFNSFTLVGLDTANRFSLMLRGNHLIIKNLNT